jgi:hypothetical protein
MRAGEGAHGHAMAAKTLTKTRRIDRIIRRHGLGTVQKRGLAALTAPA